MSNTPATIRFDFFFRAETNPRNLKGKTYREYWTARGAKSLFLDLPEDTTLGEALTAARAAGLPKGSHRSGCFEVQSGLGIFQSTHEFGTRIDPARACTFTFRTWAQLEAEELSTASTATEKERDHEQSSQGTH